MNMLEKYIAREFGYAFCIMTGSGTTSLYIVLRALDLSQKNILIPSISCPFPVYAVLLSGNNALFCDVSLENACICPKIVEDYIERSQIDVHCLIGIHLYGNEIQKFPQLLQLLNSKSIAYIDDLAQSIAIPSTSSNWSPSLASILSFGGSKTIDVGHGGAVLCNDLHLYNSLCNEYSKIDSSYSINTVNRKQQVRNAYYSILDDMKIPSLEKSAKMSMILKQNFTTFVYRYDRQYDCMIHESLVNRSRIFETRRQQADEYCRLLEHTGTVILTEATAIPWKFSIRYPFINEGDSLDLVRVMSNNGFCITNHYSYLPRMFGNDHITDNIASKIISREVVNFPLGEGLALETITKHMNMFKEIVRL